MLDAVWEPEDNVNCLEVHPTVTALDLVKYAWTYLMKFGAVLYQVQYIWTLLLNFIVVC